MAVNPAKGLVAAGFNVGIRPRIFLYNADLKGPKILELSQFVQDVCWSPDGRRLAVLYSGEIDGKGKFVGNDPHFRPLGIPDVEIFDPASGERQLRFFSGDREAKVAFSPDGTRLYTISLRDKAFNQKGAVRIFSASSGTLLKTITSSRYYLHNNFAVSPDGRFIAADASTKPPYLPLLLNVLRNGERGLYNKTARFVLLDAKTGKVRFEYHEVAPGPPGGMGSMVFAFTPDGHRLLVDPNLEGCGFGERVDVYSLGDAR
jgi:WD40 repeat protein